MTRILTLLFLISCLTSTVVASDIDLRQSTITPEKEKVPGGELVTFHVVLKNTGISRPAGPT